MKKNEKLKEELNDISKKIWWNFENKKNKNSSKEKEDDLEKENEISLFWKAYKVKEEKKNILIVSDENWDLIVKKSAQAQVLEYWEEISKTQIKNIYTVKKEGEIKYVFLDDFWNFIDYSNYFKEDIFITDFINVSDKKIIIDNWAEEILFQKYNWEKIENLYFEGELSYWYSESWKKYFIVDWLNWELNLLDENFNIIIKNALKLSHNFENKNLPKKISYVKKWERKKIFWWNNYVILD